MSYEGHIQRWCPNGHYWETDDTFWAAPAMTDQTCPDCGQKNAAWAAVDDTNCDAVGRIPITDRLPTLAELDAASTPFGFWHKDILDDPTWLERIQSEDDPKARVILFQWAKEG